MKPSMLGVHDQENSDRLDNGGGREEILVLGVLAEKSS